MVLMTSSHVKTLEVTARNKEVSMSMSMSMWLHTKRPREGEGLEVESITERSRKSKKSQYNCASAFLLPILCRAAFYCRIIAHWRSGQEELVRS